MAGNGAKLDDAHLAYRHAADLFDVTTGKNGTCAAKTLRAAAKGADGPTGLGTPNGLGAF